MTTTTPVIAGFYPDPSICRVGDDYYLATSSFEYFPGVPLFHSRDLIHWEQLGNILDRPSQLEIGIGASRGIYAPTLRFHDGRFWLVTTNVSQAKGQLIVTAEDPRGPWTDPVFVEDAGGIDPDLAWDLDGRCYLTWTTSAGIMQASVDPVAGILLEEPRRMWSGTGLQYPEAPHLYHREGWWYLLIAEGGTERGHSVSIARSRSITGPFEGAPGNPIFSHRSTREPIQNVGHSDLVELPDGTWAAVFLGVRARGGTPLFHTNGRETFLAGITWSDGWPTYDESRYDVAAVDHSFTDDLAGLHPRWISPDANPSELVKDGQLLPGGLLAVRARDEAWSFSVTVAPSNFRQVLRLDDRHWCSLDLSPDRVVARLRIGPLEQELASAPVTGPVTLRITAKEPTFGGPDDIELGFITGTTYKELTRFDGRYLSTEVAGGFTGRTLGLQSLAEATTIHEVTYTSRT
ncbi:glycosyl hydrolase family 43 [Kribbella antiqua]|uniref:Glycosyl hydrolase family 43 n=1 Tax=Kribbella antiqua TaxID=2512217 RepID=A0A4R2IX16_9ACTN|nr:glycoside hydrolase family 43 protein [Kribbella antiqua]TCO50104.1 glycosyl hydrolase family 43 [Kribbella antiqua]